MISVINDKQWNVAFFSELEGNQARGKKNQRKKSNRGNKKDIDTHVSL